MYKKKKKTDSRKNAPKVRGQDSRASALYTPREYTTPTIHNSEMRFLFEVALVNAAAAAVHASPIDDYLSYAEATISFHVSSGANRSVVGTESASSLLSSRGKALHHDALGKNVIATIQPPAWTLHLERDTSAFSDKYFDARLMYNASASQTTYHVVRQESPQCIYTGTVHADATSPAIGRVVIST